MRDHRRPSRGVEPGEAHVARQLLVDEAIGHLGARQDLVDRQVRFSIDPSTLLDLGPDGRWRPER